MFGLFRKKVPDTQGVKVVFVFTRGRTGSTAIIDELKTHPEIYGHGEVFRPNPKRLEDDIKAGLDSKDLLPFRSFQAITKKGVVEYIEYACAKTKEAGASIFCFKLLANHAAATPGLLAILSKIGADAVHLVRKDVIRQVISGIYAKQVGKYNRKDYVPDEKEFEVDCKDFVGRVKANVVGVSSEADILLKHGYNVVSATYEDYVDDKEGFYAKLFKSLGLVDQRSSETSYSIMTPKNIESLIRNFPDVVGIIRDKGYDELLDIYNSRSK